MSHYSRRVDRKVTASVNRLLVCELFQGSKSYCQESKLKSDSSLNR